MAGLLSWFLIDPRLKAHGEKRYGLHLDFFLNLNKTIGFVNNPLGLVPRHSSLVPISGFFLEWPDKTC
jgi:hypothetical protein